MKNIVRTLVILLFIGCGQTTTQTVIIQEQTPTKVIRLIPVTHQLQIFIDGDITKVDVQFSRSERPVSIKLPFSTTVEIKSGDFFELIVNKPNDEPFGEIHASIYIDDFFDQGVVTGSPGSNNGIWISGYLLDEISEPFLIYDYFLMGVYELSLPTLLSENDLAIQVSHMTQENQDLIRAFIFKE